MPLWLLIALVVGVYTLALSVALLARTRAQIPPGLVRRLDELEAGHEYLHLDVSKLRGKVTGARAHSNGAPADEASRQAQLNAAIRARRSSRLVPHIARED
jgi:hypothetical protein